MEDPGHPIFLGFTAKRRQPRSDWGTDWLPEEVEEVCCATDCMAETPEKGFRRFPDWYEFGYLQSEAEVRQAIEAEDAPGTFDIFAYRTYPVWFGEEGTHRGVHPALRPPNRAEGPRLKGYQLLGYDLLEVDRELKVQGCSPLSCNGMAREKPVNRYCLLDTLERAVEVGLEFGLNPPEPGDYVIIEVWRRQEDGVPG